MKAFKLFSIFLLFALFQTGICAEVTFSAITDACIKADKANNTMTPSIKRLLTVKDDVNLSKNDAVIFLGNNIQGANSYDLVMFAKIINKIKKPVYAGIGNKDTQKAKHLDKKEYYRLLNKFSKNKVSKLPSAKKINDFIFIFMDGTNEMVSMPRGYYKDRELIILEQYLEKYKNKDVVIVQHFPVLEMKDNMKSTFNLESYKALLARHNNVVAVISGHENEDFETEDENGIKHINIPSLNAGEYEVINIETTSNGAIIKTKIISVE